MVSSDQPYEFGIWEGRNNTTYAYFSVFYFAMQLQSSHKCFVSKNNITYE